MVESIIILTKATPPKKPCKTVEPLTHLIPDKTSLLPDQILLLILSKLPNSQRDSNFLVSKRWLNLQGRLVKSLKVLDWEFLVSGRLLLRFPDLLHLDLLPASLLSPPNSGILMTHQHVSFHIDTNVSHDGFTAHSCMLSVDEVDFGVKLLAGGYPNLRKLMLFNASEMSLLSVSEESPTLQELELHQCTDQVLRGIAACENLQILKLIAHVDGFYSSMVSDIGLTILAQGCRRLVKLELNGCQGSYDGIRAIGKCCQMLEELILTNHRLEDGWLSALSCCENLKTLKLQSCKHIDFCPGLDEHLGSCPSLQSLHLVRCQLRDKHGVRALFLVCGNAREIVFQNCWGLDNGMFSLANIARGVTFLCLEGCSQLRTQGLESVILSWKELQRLQVVSCKNIKNSEVSPALSGLFCDLKDLKWKPDTVSILQSGLTGTSMGRKGGKFFKKMINMDSNAYLIPSLSFSPALRRQAWEEKVGMFLRK